MLTQEYGDDYVRVATSVFSQGITAVGVSGGFVDTMGLSGSVYFEDGTGPSFDLLSTVIDNAFKEDYEVFFEILSESSDPFLASLESVNINVEKADTSEDTQSGLSTWVVVAIAVGSAVCSAGFLCLLCICCLGDPEDEDEDITAVKKTSSSGSGETHVKTSTKASDEVASDIDVESIHGAQLRNNQENMDVQSITSQDSSKFTYNPRTEMTEGGFTFQSCYSQEVRSSNIDADLWKYGGIIPDGAADGVEVPFGSDISAIEAGKDGPHEIDILEADSRSLTTAGSLFLHPTDVMSPHERSQATVGTYGGMSLAMSEVGIGIIEDEIEPTRTLSKRRTRSEKQSSSRQIRPSGTAQGINDDLNDLGEMVAAHRG